MFFSINPWIWKFQNRAKDSIFRGRSIENSLRYFPRWNSRGCWLSHFKCLYFDIGFCRRLSIMLYFFAIICILMEDYYLKSFTGRHQQIFNTALRVGLHYFTKIIICNGEVWPSEWRQWTVGRVKARQHSNRCWTNKEKCCWCEGRVVNKETLIKVETKSFNRWWWEK